MLRICESCKRDSSIINIKTFDDRLICTGCKNLFYRVFDKAYEQILNVNSLKQEFSKVCELLWEGFLTPNRFCKLYNDLDFYRFCGTDKNTKIEYKSENIAEKKQFGSSEVIECPRCKFRCMFFILTPPMWGCPDHGLCKHSISNFFTT